MTAFNSISSSTIPNQTPEANITGQTGLLDLTDPAGNAKSTFRDIFATQLSIVQHTSTRTPFFLPSIGQVDPNNPADLAKIELFTDLLNLRSDVVAQGLQAFQRLEDSSAAPLKG